MVQDGLHILVVSCLEYNLGQMPSDDSLFKGLFLILFGLLLLVKQSAFVSGGSPLYGFVKTDLNWLSSISALPLLSIDKCGSLFSGAILFESCLFYLT